MVQVRGAKLPISPELAASVAEGIGGESETGVALGQVGIESGCRKTGYRVKVSRVENGRH